jgi:hypothetical protein
MEGIRRGYDDVRAGRARPAAEYASRAEIAETGARPVSSSRRPPSRAAGDEAFT